MYKASNPFNVGNIESFNSLESDNAQVYGYISDDEGICEQDILSGRCDNAAVRLFLFDIKNNKIIRNILTANIVSITMQDSLYYADLCNKIEKMQSIDAIFSLLRGAKLYDAQCKANARILSKEGRVTDVMMILSF